MANQEVGKGGIFGISAPPRERTSAPVLPRPDVRPAPVFPEPGKPPKTKKSLIRRLAGNLALRIALAGTALAGTGYAAYQEIPAVHRAIDNLIGADTVPSVPSTFDNNVGKTRFGEKNIRRVTPQQAKEENLLEPKIRIDETDTVIVTTLLPGIFPSSIPDTTIDTKVYQPRGTGADYMPPSIDKFLTLPEGYQLTIPKGAHYVLFPGNPEANQNPDLVYTIIAFSFNEELNLTFIWTFGSNGFIPEDNQNTIDRKTYNEQYNPAFGGRDGKYKELPLSDGITPVTKPTSLNQRLSVHLSVISGSDISPDTLFKNREELFREVLLENFARDQKLDVLSSE